jgi:diguanylate cyclase (GGDEF)-like protein
MSMLKPEPPNPPASTAPAPAQRRRLGAYEVPPAEGAAPAQPARVRRRAPWLALGVLGGAALLAGGFAALASALGLVPWASAGLAALLAVLGVAGPLAAAMAQAERRHAQLAGDAKAQDGADTVPAARVESRTLRELFLQQAEREFTRSRRYGIGAALLLVDLDHLDALRSAIGPLGAEALLDELRRRVAPSLRGADTLARFGSGQLAIFLVHADATGALDVAERIREQVEQLEVAQAGGRRLRITVSLGVAHLRPAHTQLAALLSDAQDALWAARQVGGNCVRAAPVDVPPRVESGPTPHGGVSPG